MSIFSLALVNLLGRCDHLFLLLAAQQKRQEIADQVKDVSKNFEVMMLILFQSSINNVELVT